VDTTGLSGLAGTSRHVPSLLVTNTNRVFIITAVGIFEMQPLLYILSFKSDFHHIIAPGKLYLVHLADSKYPYVTVSSQGADG
jgi:hypothetical protein